MLHKLFTLLFVLLMSRPVLAMYTLPINDAKAISFQQDIETIFISQPSIVDYKVINEREVVIFGTRLGQAKLIAYGVNGQRLLSKTVRIIQPIANVQQQVAERFPELDIDVTMIGNKASVRGMVYTEKQRDDIYALVAGLLGKEKKPRWEGVTDNTVSFESGSLLQTDPATRFYRNYTYEDLIEGLTLSLTYQVNVKATIAQVSSAFSEAIGVDWFTLSGSVGNNSGTFNFPSLSADELSATITALDNDSLAEVLAQPNLTVMSGENASFLVGGEIPMLTVNNDNQAVTFKEYGIGLDVSANVKSEQQIRLNVQPSVTAVERTITFSNGTEVPQLFSRRTATTIELADGQSFLISGLMNNEDLEQLSKIPILGDVPLFGALFSRAVTQRQRSEVVILVTVHLVKPVAANKLQLPRIQKTTTLERLLNLADDDVDQNNELYKNLIRKGGFSR